MKLIDKEKVVEEIRRIMAEEMSFFKDCIEDELEVTSSPAVYTRMKMLLSFLNTLETKEVDFEKEWKEYFKYRGDMATVNIIHLAKHFFELGLKAKEGKEL